VSAVSARESSKSAGPANSFKACTLFAEYPCFAHPADSSIAGSAESAVTAASTIVSAKPEKSAAFVKKLLIPSAVSATSAAAEV